MEVDLAALAAVVAQNGAFCVLVLLRHRHHRHLVVDLLPNGRQVAHRFAAGGAAVGLEELEHVTAPQKRVSHLQIAQLVNGVAAGENGDLLGA